MMSILQIVAMELSVVNASACKDFRSHSRVQEVRSQLNLT